MLIVILLLIVAIVVGKKLYEAEKEKKRNIAQYSSEFAKEKQNFGYRMSELCGFERDSILVYSTAQRDMEKALRSMEGLNRNLTELSQSEDRSAEIAQCRKELERLAAFEARIKEVSQHGMMDPEHYGQVDQRFMDAVRAMTAQEVEDLLNRCESAKEQGTLNAITTINPERLMQALWVLGMEKPYRAKEFERLTDICSWFFASSYPVDAEMARWYAQRQMGGPDSVEIGDIRKCLSERLASCLMWLQAYRQEQRVLQEMLKENCTMSPKAQERLHALNNGGGKAPDTHEAVSGGDELSFDVSALSWRDEEYNALFESLAFQDKKLTYGLAVRDEDKDLLLPAGVQLPGKDAMLAKFQADFAEEYGDQATARSAEFVMLSGGGEERMEGILAVSADCRQLGVAAHMARIGKKVNIKFYTLFLPEGLELAAQKQQALSLSRKLNPTVSMWENGLKTSMLTAIQQLLNSSAQGGGQQPDAPIPNSDGGAPVF